MDVLITGVAGYIGAHVAHEFLENGHNVIGIDDLSSGKKEFVDPRIDFVQGSVQDENTLNRAFAKIKNKDSSGVVHCAGYKYAGESLKIPLEFYENNFFSTLQLIQKMKEFSLKNLVYSSSCSIYGEISGDSPVKEHSEKNPISPYGRSKLFSELMIADAAATGLLNCYSLRYFNVAGNGNISAHDVSPYNLFPILYRSIINKEPFRVFGSDFPTKDGTCVRDYVDVTLLAKQHFNAMKNLISGIDRGFHAFNLGSGIGHSVLEITDAAKRLIYPNLEIIFENPREGDPSYVVADTKLAKKLLNWQHSISLDEMTISGWKAFQKNK